jgi:hypothetical protein
VAVPKIDEPTLSKSYQNNNAKLALGETVIRHVKGKK